MRRPLLVSVALGIATSVVIGLADTYLPYSKAKVWVIDAVTLPGALVAGPFYPEGSHTGRGAPSFGAWAMAANLAVYIGSWYAVLRVLGHFWRRGTAPVD